MKVVDFYNANRGKFRVPESFHVPHIVKNVDERQTEAEALTALLEAEKDLRSGIPFAEVANRWSDCGGAGGELEWFARGEMVKEFESAIERLRPGHVSAIFPTVFGFHIAKLHARRPAGVRALSEVFAAIELELRKQQQETKMGEFLDKLRAKATIEPRD